ncbi:CvpA family protein [Aquimarina sp. MMG015]|uniref:CvpA family protein n=1 Tax=Aquimarina TaxID=290174 RepID=UPI0004235885|nr:MULTISPECIES: CvpA family protein [Aquimarina]AXT57473.1 CvpA family protein [Aquimarina sp. AD1]MBQ4801276.1 CvpA family protein [Aquimarina sp. MMG015]RKN08780.1 CvpA family protein [Aquimarina sp. AD1]
MNYIDIILGILLLWGLIKGFSKGLFVSLASLVALVAGIYVSVHFSHLIGGYLEKYLNWGDGALKLTAFAITFIGVVILISLAGKLLTKIADFASLGILNKLLGAAFGVLKFAFIASVIIIFVDAANRSLNLIKQETLDSSILYAPVKKIAPTVLPNILRDTTKEEDQKT